MNSYIHIIVYLKKTDLDVCLPDGKPVLGFLGNTLPPNKDQKIKKINEVKVDDYDVLVLPVV